MCFGVRTDEGLWPVHGGKTYTVILKTLDYMGRVAIDVVVVVDVFVVVVVFIVGFQPSAPLSVFPAEPSVVSDERHSRRCEILLCVLFTTTPPALIEGAWVVCTPTTTSILPLLCGNQ